MKDWIVGVRKVRKITSVGIDAPDDGTGRCVSLFDSPDVSATSPVGARH